MYKKSLTGNVINPIADARLGTGMSLDRLGKKLALSKQYISRAEQGTYTTINGKLLKWTSEELRCLTRTVMARYFEFQQASRVSTMEEINPRLLARGLDTRPGGAVFATWREAYWPSVIAFANAFCVHPDLVRNYEEGIREVMPNPVFKALTEVKAIDPNWTEAMPKAIERAENSRGATRHEKVKDLIGDDGTRGGDYICIMDESSGEFSNTTETLKAVSAALRR